MKRFSAISASIFVCVGLLTGFLVSGCTNTPAGPPPISVTLSPGGSPAIDQGQTLTITATVTNDSKNAGVTWSASGGGNVASCTAGTTSCVYTAPTSGAKITATVTATSVTDTTKYNSVNIVVSQPPAFTTDSLPNGTNGKPYTGATLAATGGAGALTYSVVSASGSGNCNAGTSLPAGLSLNSASGAITGTPSQWSATACSFTAKVTDASTGQVGTLPAGPLSNTANLSITINAPAAPTITSTSPLASGTYNTTYKNADGTTVTLQGTCGLPGTCTWTWSAVPGSSLPPGLSLNSSTGAITGTPTQWAPTPYKVNVTYADSSNPQQAAYGNFWITINPVSPGPTPSPGTGALPSATAGQAAGQYSTDIGASGGLGPYTFSYDATSQTPSWVTTPMPNQSNAGWVQNNRALTAADEGTYNNIVVDVTDSENPPVTVKATYSVTVNPPAPLQITTTSPLPSGQAGVAYGTGGNGVQLAATGGFAPYTWQVDPHTVTLLPAGLTLSSSGLISGTPTAGGGFSNITIDVTDSATPTHNTTNATFSVTMAAGVITVTPGTGALPPATVGVAYSQTITASGGVPPYNGWNTSGLPLWLSASAPFTKNNPNDSITLSGTPAAGDIGTDQNITVGMSDSETGTVAVGSATYSITVNAAAACTSQGKESLLHGQYAMVLRGFDFSGKPAAIGAVFDADGTGRIALSVGRLEFNYAANNLTGANAASIVTSSSCYQVGLDTGGGYRGKMVIVNSSNGQAQAFRFALSEISPLPVTSSSVAHSGHIIEFDNSGAFPAALTAGTLRLQDSSAFNGSFNGSYAFGVAGETPASSPNKFGAAGVLNLNGSGGVSTNGSEMDINQNGTGPAGPVPIASGGNYNINTSYGYGTLSFTPNCTGCGGTNASVYVVSANELLVLSQDNQATGGYAYIGSALKQSGGPFSTSSVSGNYVGYDSELGSGPGYVHAEFFRASASGGNATVSSWQDDSGTIQAKCIVKTDTFPNCTTAVPLSVDSYGRMTAGGSVIFYLVNSGQAFFLSMDNGVGSGFMESQTATTLTGTPTLAFGPIQPEDPAVDLTEGWTAFNTSALTLSGVNDDNAGGSLSPDGTFGPMSYSMDASGNGVGYVPSGCTFGGTGNTGCQTVFVVIDSTHGVSFQLLGGNNNTTPVNASVLQTLEQ